MRWGRGLMHHYRLPDSQVKPLFPPEKMQAMMATAAEMRSNVCCCGHWKKRGNALCFDCFMRLPAWLVDAVQRRVGLGLEEGLAEAKNWLQEFWRTGRKMDFAESAVSLSQAKEVAASSRSVRSDEASVWPTGAESE